MARRECSAVGTALRSVWYLDVSIPFIGPRAETIRILSA
jgi:hypothetical protein